MKNTSKIMLGLMSFTILGGSTITQSVNASHKHHIRVNNVKHRKHAKKNTARKHKHVKYNKKNIHNSNDIVDVSPHMLSWENFGGNVNTQQLNNGKIYYSISGNDNFHNAFEQAVKQWNKLNVVQLVEDNNASTIKLHGNYNKQDDDTQEMSPYQLGLTSSHIYSPINSGHGNQVSYLSDSSVYLSSTLINQSNKFKINVATHELGHALGFNDEYNNSDKNNVMYYKGDDNPEGKFSRLGQSEKMTLNHYYNEY